MKYRMLAFLGILCFVACSTIDKTQLVGHWKNDQWEMKFAEDGSCSFGRPGGGMKDNLSYRVLGNTVEIAEQGKVILSGLTIQSVDEEVLKVQFRNLVGSGDQMDNNQILQRQN